MYKKLISAFLLFLTLLAPALAEEEFLRPDQAFMISAEALDRQTVRVSWEIAEGYYLYQSKFRFKAENPAISFGDPDMPKAIRKDDPIFGPVEIYRNKVTLDVPVDNVPADADMLTLKARSQGCADKGICYPPHTQTVLVALTQAVDAPPPVNPADIQEIGGNGSDAGDALAELSALSDDLGLDAMEDDILPPDEAFKVSALSLDGNTLEVSWQIAEGTYLYQDKVKVALEAEGIRLGEYQLPKPDIKKDSITPEGDIGDVAVYHDAVTLKIPLLRDNTAATTIDVKTAYQGCADRGICYPPQKTTLKVNLPASAGASGVAATPATTEEKVAAPAVSDAVDMPVNEQDAILADLQSASPLLAIALSLGFGILVAFTACMYPMIPILSSLIMGQGEKVTAVRSFNLSLAYTQGIAITFGVLGAVMAVVGKELGIQSSLQTPWVLVPSAILFIALAMSMFGFYQIQMPSAIQSRLNDMSNKQQGGSLLGVGLMGVISALIVGPCGGPVLLAVLAFAAQSQDMLNGFIYLWVFGTGMGLPLLLMGAGGGALLPKAGTWMDTVKATGGVIMLALALSFLERMSPTYIATEVIMLMWGMLLVTVAVYLGALRQLPEDVSGWSKLWKGLGVVFLIYGAMFLVGVAAGGKDTNQPLSGLSVGGGHAAQEQAHAAFKQVKTVEDLNRELAAAKAAGKPVALDFYADWCTYCKVMEKEIFPDPKVVKAFDDFVLLQADITRQDDDDKAISEHLNLTAPPAIYFWDRDGNAMPQYRLVGNVTAAQLAAQAGKVAQ